MAAVEQLFRPVDGGLFDNIDELPAAMEAVARVTLEGLVGHRMAESVEDGAAHDIFGGDQFDLVLLAVPFIIQGLGDKRVARMNRGSEIFFRLGGHGRSQNGIGGVEESLSRR